MADCEFCMVVHELAEAHVVFEDERTVAFLDDHPAASGHCLVVPRTHSRNLLDAQPADAAAVMVTASTVARMLDRELRPDGFTILQNNEEAAWQGTFHLHVHVIPRWRDDDLYSPWEPEPGDDAQLRELARRLTGTA